MKTVVITNFSGRLTRIINGDLNSGFAKFTTSFGYDPYTKPMNLTWLETASILSLPNSSLVQAAKVLSSFTGPLVHMVDQGGNWYQMLSSNNVNPNLNSVVGIASIRSQSFLYGTSMEFYGSVVGADQGGNALGKLHVGGDGGVTAINPNGGGEALVGNVNYYTQGIFRPLTAFAGKLNFGNGNTIGQIDSTGTVVSSVVSTGTNAGIYSSLNPPLETQTKVLDMEVNTENTYLTMASSNVLVEERMDVPGSDIVETFGSQGGKLNRWNGTDQTITEATSVPSYFLSAIQTWFRNTAFFANDTFGTAFNDGSNKLLSLPNNKPPSPNAVSNNGNFITWACAEVVGNARYLSLYYYGALDQENPSGLYRVLRWAAPLTNSLISKVPLNTVVSNKFTGVNNLGALTTFGYGKHYISASAVNSTSDAVYLLSFLITPTGTGTPQPGVYETQTQLFSKRIGTAQIRVYCEPTITGNAFQLDLIGADGSIIPNGTYTYSYGDIRDPQTDSFSVERINFPGNIKSQFSLGIRITNTGTTNMTIKKIEIDLDEEGK